MNKYALIGILAVLFLATSAQAQYTTNPYDDYNGFSAQQFITTLTAGETREINIRGFNYALKEYKPPSSSNLGGSVVPTNATIANVLYIIAETADGNPLLPEPFIVNCSGLAPVSLDYVYYLNPIHLGYSIIEYNPFEQIIPEVILGSNSQYVGKLMLIQSGSNNQLFPLDPVAYPMDWSAACTITANQDLDMSIMTLQDYVPYENVLFKTPNDGITELINNLSNTITSAFGAFNLFMVVGTFILVLFLFVFIWKLFEYFVTRLRRGKQL